MTVTSPLYVYRRSFCAVRRFHQHLRKRGVRMDIARDLMWSQLHHVGQGQLGQQFSHLGADHVCAEDFPILIVHDDLDEARVITESERLAVWLEGEAPHLDVIATLLRLRLCQAERG